MGTLVGIVEEMSAFLVVGGGRVVTSRFEKINQMCKTPILVF